MNKLLLFLVVGTLIVACTPPASQKCPEFSSEDKAAIMTVMNDQEQAWSDGDVDRFMLGYWNADSLTFVGSRGLTFGWQATLDNYRKGYPTRASMGKLDFNILRLEGLAPDAAFMIGKWHLTREGEGNEDIGGHFTLLWRKIDGKWVIVADHTS